jgi:predicted RNA polymerase sigma factor
VNSELTNSELIPHLFRTEYRKIVSVLVKLFGIEHIETAEDIASDTFLLAAETWGLKGLPKNPTAWLYTVAKNKTKDQLKHGSVFDKKIAPELKRIRALSSETEIDLSEANINDSQLQMMFAICHPGIPVEAQIGLSLNILCGFGADEIADAFLTNREATYKRLQRAKEKLRTDKVEISIPSAQQLNDRLETVLTTLYLLFSEGYYSSSQNTSLRKDLCVEAMRLNLMLVENESTNTPSANALLALMCFHSSRFDARVGKDGASILYEEQDESLWNQELIIRGEEYLNRASVGTKLSRYHLEAGIAFWHTQTKDSPEKWETILQYYNRLLQLEYSPVAALNRTYALSKARSKQEAIAEAENLKLTDNHLYFALLGNLYTGIDSAIAGQHLRRALSLAKTDSSKQTLIAAINRLS